MELIMQGFRLCVGMIMLGVIVPILLVSMFAGAAIMFHIARNIFETIIGFIGVLAETIMTKRVDEQDIPPVTREWER